MTGSVIASLSLYSRKHCGTVTLTAVPRLELGGLTGKPLLVESTLLPSSAAGSGPAARPGSMPQGFGSDFGGQSLLSALQAHACHVSSCF